MSEREAIKCWVENAGIENVVSVVVGQNEAMRGLQKNNDAFVKSYREALDEKYKLESELSRYKAMVEWIPFDKNDKSTWPEIGVSVLVSLYGEQSLVAILMDDGLFYENGYGWETVSKWLPIPPESEK
jgi:hypothetical protein